MTPPAVCCARSSVQVNVTLVAVRNAGFGIVATGVMVPALLIAATAGLPDVQALVTVRPAVNEFVNTVLADEPALIVVGIAASDSPHGVSALVKPFTSALVVEAVAVAAEKVGATVAVLADTLIVTEPALIAVAPVYVTVAVVEPDTVKPAGTDHAYEAAGAPAG